MLWTDIAHTNTDRHMANRSPFAKFEVHSSLCLDAIVVTADGRTDRHSSNVLEFRADQMSSRNIGSQIIISWGYKLIGKFNIPSMRKV